MAVKAETVTSIVIAAAYVAFLVWIAYEYKKQTRSPIDILVNTIAPVKEPKMRDNEG